MDSVESLVHTARDLCVLLVSSSGSGKLKTAIFVISTMAKVCSAAVLWTGLGAESMTSVC